MPKFIETQQFTSNKHTLERCIRLALAQLHNRTNQDIGVFTRPISEFLATRHLLDQINLSSEIALLKQDPNRINLLISFYQHWAELFDQRADTKITDRILVQVFKNYAREIHRKQKGLPEEKENNDPEYLTFRKNMRRFGDIGMEQVLLNYLPVPCLNQIVNRASYQTEAFLADYDLFLKGQE